MSGAEILAEFGGLLLGGCLMLAAFWIAGPRPKVRR